MLIMLLREGHHVESFADGSAILRYCQSGHSFDLLISDIGLPDENGWQILPKLRAHCADFKALAVTGFTGAEDVERCRVAGFDAVLKKPVSFARLLDEINRLLPTK